MYKNLIYKKLSQFTKLYLNNYFMENLLFVNNWKPLLLFINKRMCNGDCMHIINI